MIEGFLRVASVSPETRVADVRYNVEKIISTFPQLVEKGVQIAVYPELCITGYTCGDLFHNDTLINAASDGLAKIVAALAGCDMHVIVGLPVKRGGLLYNCAALIRDGEVDIVDKTYLPGYNEFYESRWFAPSSVEEPQVFESHGVKIGIELCEDLWSPIPPSSYMALSGAQVIFNLSASNDLSRKYEYLLSLIEQQSARCISGYVYSSVGFGESTTDTTFLPKTIIAECGTILAKNDISDFLGEQIAIADIDIAAIAHDRLHDTSFGKAVRRTVVPEFDIQTSVPAVERLDYRSVSRNPYVDGGVLTASDCERINIIQISSLARRLMAVKSNKMIVGISGGLDSTLALLVAYDTIKKTGGDAKDIIAVTMPGFGTSDRTHDNAVSLMQQLGVTIREISIVDSVLQHFKDISHNPDVRDVTYENSQARERTQILMDIANQEGGIVLGTGDLSELALGWCTYNGDHMSMYAINAGIPKTMMQKIVGWYADCAKDAKLAETLRDIVDTPISPELTPADNEGKIAQKTEELVGPYELSDFFLYYTLRYGFTATRIFELARKAFEGQYDELTILKWQRKFYWRFFSQQFKRSCMPDGPKVFAVSLSPRSDWKMPSDASSALWIDEVDRLIEKYQSSK